MEKKFGSFDDFDKELPLGIYAAYDGKTGEYIELSAEEKSVALLTPWDCARNECGAKAFVYPISWNDRGEVFDVHLRCPCCELHIKGVLTLPTINEFDEIINEGTELVTESLGTYAVTLMREEIERFRKALDENLVEPFDF